MFRFIILAARPKTLPAAIVPVWLGCTLSFFLFDSFSVWLAAYTLLGALCIQMATNFFNDAIDAAKGADTSERLGPERATASGLMSPVAVYACAFLCLLLAAIFGLFLLMERGWVLLAIGVPSFYLTYGYTGGPLPLAYRGLGELFVLIFFGWIAVVGTVFIQTDTWQIEAFLLGTQVGLLSAILIAINNIRDCPEDTKTGKFTLAVIFGEKTAFVLVWIMTLLCYALGVCWWLLGIWFVAFIPLLALPLGLWICLRLHSCKGKFFNLLLASSAVQLLFFALLWTLGMILYAL